MIWFVQTKSLQGFHQFESGFICDYLSLQESKYEIWMLS